MFLVFGAAGVYLIFGHQLSKAVTSVRAGLLVALAVIIARILLAVYLWTSKAKSGFTWRNLLYNLVNFAAPMSLGAVGIHLITGRHFWQTPTGLIMTASLLIGLLAMSVSFVYFIVGQTPHGRLHQLSRWLNVLLAVSLGLILLSVSWHSHHLRSLALAYLVMFGVAMAAVQFILWLGARERYMFWFVSGLALATPPLLALANSPYLAFPILPLVWAYRLASDELALGLGLGAVLVICIVGFGWLAERLLLDTRRSR